MTNRLRWPAFTLRHAFVKFSKWKCPHNASRSCCKCGRGHHTLQLSRTRDDFIYKPFCCKALLVPGWWIWRHVRLVERARMPVGVQCSNLWCRTCLCCGSVVFLFRLYTPMQNYQPTLWFVHHRLKNLLPSLSNVTIVFHFCQKLYMRVLRSLPNECRIPWAFVERMK